MTYNAEKNLTPLYIGKKILRTFSFIFILLLAPEEGLLFFWNRNIGEFVEIYIFLFYSFVYFFIALPWLSVCRCIFFYKKFSPIPPSPQKANGQPLREWGKKRILNLSKCYPSTNGWRAFVMWWFSRLKCCLCWGGTFLEPLSQIWRSTGFCFRTHVIFHVYCPTCLCNQTARHFLSLLCGWRKFN